MTTMERMFEEASQFSKDLSNWKNTIQASVNTQYMFVDAGIADIPNWKKEGEASVCFDPTNGENIVADKAELQKKVTTQ